MCAIDRALGMVVFSKPEKVSKKYPKSIQKVSKNYPKSVGVCNRKIDRALGIKKSSVCDGCPFWVGRLRSEVSGVCVSGTAVSL
jgi:hypothetical protein